ncbi:hypothetical protein ABEB36_002973 [Hypothenemus hampei]|uniref:Uncharacterized protein n=1 Tax=Hypothenemus hampei TaxID=57062 RepID=A0ABD1F7L2_HYPHA
MLAAKVPLFPRSYYGFKDLSSVNILIDFDTHILENQLCFAADANSTPDYDRLCILAAFDDGRRAQSLCTPDSIILMIVIVFNCEKLLICDNDPLPTCTCDLMLELTASLEPHALIFIRVELNFLELLCLEVELLFSN